MAFHRFRPGALLGALVILFASGPGGLTAQEEPLQAGNGGLHVFFECHTGGCDFREFRTEIDWVSWVRDRQDADLHVIVTSQQTGSGGRSYQLDFIGLEDLEGVDDQLTYTSLGTDVRDETVQGLLRVLAVGLARYNVLADGSAVLDVRRVGGDEPVTDRLVTADEVEDPWDFWVFEVGLSTDFSGESSRTSKRVSGSVEATRTTETWKLEFDAGGSWRQSEIELSDSTLVDTRRDWRASAAAVYALASRWSLGVDGRASAATRTNQDLSVSLAPALEFSVWPYEESPRRSLRFRYTVGARHFNYEEVTLFGHTEETRGYQELEVSIRQRQPWGSVFANLEGSHYLHDLEKYRVSTGGFLSFRIVRGLNLRVNGRVSWIRDQLFLPAEDIPDEEILLQRRRLASSFDWDFGVGFSFQFGSIYNNVVNNRF